MWVAVEWSSMILCISLIRRVTHVDDLVKAQYIHRSWKFYHMFFIFILFWSVCYMTFKVLLYLYVMLYHDAEIAPSQLQSQHSGKSEYFMPTDSMLPNRWNQNWLIRFWIGNSKETQLPSITHQRSYLANWASEVLSYQWRNIHDQVLTEKTCNFIYLKFCLSFTNLPVTRFRQIALGKLQQPSWFT